MAERTDKKRRTVRHRGRGQQIPIYFMKHIRMFVYQKDWIVLPMSALIAGMVSLVIRRGFGRNMEYTLTGAFALTCVAIWNGCFNSIQVVCRERAIVKREHRSGMHVTSYIASHMLYQALLCMLQSILTMYICRMCGVNVDGVGVITPWMIVDLGLSMFLVSYVSDMLALFVSSVVRTTTAAMTVMPFILIFQLVFAGAVFQLPEWAKSVSKYTISNYGMNVIAAQARYNELPMETGWGVLEKLKNEVVLEPRTLQDLLEENDLQEFEKDFPQEKLNEIAISTMTVGDILNMVGEEKVKETILTKTSEASQRESFESSVENIIVNWFALICLGLFYLLCAVVCLEFIDKDKR